MLILAGNLIVTGARGIAVALGMDAFVIGATIVAVGTSVPELATTVIAKLRGHDEVGLGTILGSNIFNGLFIISVAAIIHPITVGWRELALTLAVGLVALIFAFPPRSGFIGRSRGILLLVLYVGYVVAILQQKPA
jgi:cation:H+ antiporter